MALEAWTTNLGVMCMYMLSMIKRRYIIIIFGTHCFNGTCAKNMIKLIMEWLITRNVLIKKGMAIKLIPFGVDGVVVIQNICFGVIVQK